MDRIARASTDERRLVFEAAAQRMALAPAVVEKDFWVCYTLDHLFHRSGFAESMVFKGGTSLSKAFGLIERFSEDIDLILDWRLLGYGEDEPWEPRSNSAQERFKTDSILHQEANRPEGKAMPRRYSRHYYDMYRLGHSFVLGRAVAHPGLLEQVVRFKEKFYRTPWAKLADARPGTLRLAPPKGRLDELAADYASMRPMLFGSYPSIDEIVAYMAELEETINGLS